MLIQLFKKSPQDDPDYRLKPQYLLEGNRTDSLTHVMHLFDEKRKYPPAPTLGPLPIKANGAIVVHRPTPNKWTRSPEEEEYTDDEDDGTIMKEVAVIKDDVVEDQLVFSMADSKDVIDLMQQENRRLQRQLLIERERNEDGQKSKDKQNKSLREALHTIQQLEKKVARYQHLFPPKNDFSEQAKRRQSTGSNLVQLMPTKVSYEHKLHILLNEIDAMQCDENNVRQRIYQYKNEKERLERIVSYKDETIRQLVHEREVLLALHH